MIRLSRACILLICVFFVSCASQQHATQSAPIKITPPVDFDPDSYIDPAEYDLAPSVRAESVQEPDNTSVQNSAFEKAKLVGGVKKLQMSVDYPR